MTPKPKEKEVKVEETAPEKEIIIDKKGNINTFMGTSGEIEVNIKENPLEIDKTVEETIKEELKDINLPVSVYDNDRLIRTYNVKDHGEDYKEKAVMFANKNNYQVR